MENMPLDSKVMTEEIFGPILPLITLDDKDASFLEDLTPWSDKLSDSCRFIKQ